MIFLHILAGDSGRLGGRTDGAVTDVMSVLQILAGRF